MKKCDKCGAKNLNSAQECENCRQHIEVTEEEVSTFSDQDAEHQRKVLAALDNLNYNISKMASDKASNMKISGVSMGFEDMVALILKWTIASVPAAALIFVVSLGIGWIFAV